MEPLLRLPYSTTGGRAIPVPDYEAVFLHRGVSPNLRLRSTPWISLHRISLPFLPLHSIPPRAEERRSRKRCPLAVRHMLCLAPRRSGLAAKPVERT
jgi:hypothetical protein